MLLPDYDTPGHRLVQATTGKLSAVRRLVEAGADLEFVHWGTSPCLTPLMGAACSGREDIVEYLLSRGALVNKCVNGNTALSQALVCDKENVAGILLRHGASINIVDSEKKSALHVACKKRFMKHAVILIRSGIDVSLRDNDGKLAFDYIRKPEDRAALEALAQLDCGLK